PELPERVLLHLVLDAAPAERADLAAAGVDGHQRARLLGSGPPRLDDLAEDQLAAGFEVLDQVAYDFAHASCDSRSIGFTIPGSPAVERSGPPARLSPRRRFGNRFAAAARGGVEMGGASEVDDGRDLLTLREVLGRGHLRDQGVVRGRERREDGVSLVFEPPDD